MEEKALLKVFYSGVVDDPTTNLIANVNPVVHVVVEIVVILNIGKLDKFSLLYPENITQWVQELHIPRELVSGHVLANVRSGLFYEQTPAMSRSPQIKMERWPKAGK